jgi:lipid-A-disaccharide synthase-like uncharacterized protein
MISRKNNQSTMKAHRLDKVGLFLSVLCAVHCALLPILITVLPLLGTSLTHNLTLEISLIGSSLLIAGFVFVKDYIQTHKSLLPLLLLSVGIGAKMLALFYFEHSYEPVVITSGAAFIALAFFANWKLRASHQSCKC